MQSYPLDTVLAKLTNIQKHGNRYTAHCPAHDDQHSSLSITEGDDGRVLIYCHAGCLLDEVLARLDLQARDLFPANIHGKRHQGEEGPAIPRRTTAQPHTSALDDTNSCTLARYADAKGLPVEFLQRLGLSDIYCYSQPTMRIPYYGPERTQIAVRLRTALVKATEGEDNRFRWRSGSKVQPYGLWRLDQARAAGYITLCEGESDPQTLWYHEEPALGIPGASTWREDWTTYLEGIPRIYAVIEPDKGGSTFQEALAKSRLRDQVYLIKCKDAKDPSALYLQDRQGFKAAWQTALREAIPLAASVQEAREQTSRAAWALCKDLATDSDILGRFADELQRQKIVGERRVVKLLYLALTSRLLSRPVSMAVKGVSSAGKSFLVQSVLDHFPPSAYYALTAMSERALAYSEAPLAHRHLVIYEAAGMSGDFATYIIRSLLSEGRVRYETVEKTRDGLRPRLIEREGPTGLIVTTTAPRLHPENETRLLSITVGDNPEQTRQIMRALAVRGGESSRHTALQTWQALQQWLEAQADTQVFIPYAETLAELVPPAAVRLRRDFGLLLNLISAHALLHRANRERDRTGQIIAELDDYRAVYDLVADLMAEGVEASVSDTIRATVEAVTEICRASEAASVKQVARHLKIDRSSAHRRIEVCLDRGYLHSPERGKGRPLNVTVGDPLPEQQAILPTPETLMKVCRCADVQGKIDAPSPPANVPPLCSNCGTLLTPEELCPFCDGQRLEALVMEGVSL